MSFHPVPGVRGGAKLYTYGDGYYYKLNNKREQHGTAHYQCYRNLCNARLHSPRGSDKPKKNKNFPDHNHESEPRLAAVFKLREKIRSRIINEGQPPKKIFDEECAKVPIEVSSSLNYAKMESTLHKVLKKSTPPIPKSGEEFNYFLSSSARFNRTTNGKEFYRGNITSIGGNKNFVFLSENFIEMFAKSTEVHLALLPRRLVPSLHGLQHMLVIMAVAYEYAFPVSFVLMSDPTVESFKAIFQLIRSLVPSLEPIKIICDFESGMHDAICEEFPKSMVLFSWWNFCNCIIQQVANYGLNDAMKNQQVTAIIQKCMCLPFLPSALIKGGLDVIRQTVHEIDVDLSPILGYLDQFIEDVGPDQISVCNSPEQTRTDFEFLEKDLMTGGVSKPKSGPPTIWNFIERIQRIEESFHKLYIMMARGQTFRYKKIEGRKMLLNNKVVKNAIDQTIKDPSRTSVEEFFLTVSTHISKYKGIPTSEEFSIKDEILGEEEEDSGGEGTEADTFFFEVPDLGISPGDNKNKKTKQLKEKICPVSLTMLPSHSTQEWQPMETMSCSPESQSSGSMINLRTFGQNDRVAIEDEILDMLSDSYDDSGQYTIQPDQNEPRLAQNFPRSCNSQTKIDKRFSRPHRTKSGMLTKLNLEEKMIRLEERKIKAITNIQKKNEQKSEEGDDYHFFMSLIPFIKPLPPVQKLLVRGKIQSLVMDAYSENESQNKVGQTD